eukprot:387482-Amphidinium_carterae.1
MSSSTKVGSGLVRLDPVELASLITDNPPGVALFHGQEFSSKARLPAAWQGEPGSFTRVSDVANPTSREMRVAIVSARPIGPDGVHNGDSLNQLSCLHSSVGSATCASCACLLAVSGACQVVVALQRPWVQRLASVSREAHGVSTAGLASPLVQPSGLPK